MVEAAPETEAHYTEYAIEEFLVRDEPYYRPIGDELELFTAAYRQHIPVLLKGPTGCGKTRFVEFMAWKLGRPLAVVKEKGAEEEKLQHDVDSTSIYFASCDGVRCHRVCKPGDILTLQIRPRNIRHPLALFQGNITVDGEKTAVAEEIKLAFDYERTSVDESHNGSRNGGGIPENKERGTGGDRRLSKREKA